MFITDAFRRCDVNDSSEDASWKWISSRSSRATVVKKSRVKKSSARFCTVVVRDHQYSKNGGSVTITLNQCVGSPGSSGMPPRAEKGRAEPRKEEQIVVRDRRKEEPRKQEQN